MTHAKCSQIRNDPCRGVEVEFLAHLDAVGRARLHSHACSLTGSHRDAAHSRDHVYGSKASAAAAVVPYTRCAMRSGASSLGLYRQIGLYRPASGRVT